MDNVDFPARSADGLDRGWTPLRDAIAAVVKPLHARIARTNALPAPIAEPRLDTAPDGWPPAGHDHCDRLMAELREPVEDPAPTFADSQMEIFDHRELHAAIRATALEEPVTVAQARALLANPHAAIEEPEVERQVAWLVALADLQHRRAAAAKLGGTAA